MGAFWLVGEWLVAWLVVGWLVVDWWLVAWLVGWLVGWFVGCMYSFLNLPNLFLFLFRADSVACVKRQGLRHLENSVFAVFIPVLNVFF